MIDWKWAPWLPVLLAQGWWVRKTTPRLAGAAGPVEGIVQTTPSQGAPPVDLIVLGESTVAGIGAPTHNEALTGSVARVLASELQRDVRWFAAGLSGATAAVALRELVPRLKGRRAHLVVLALGVNDSIDSALNPRALNDWDRNLRQLIHATRSEVGPAHILISGAPPLARFPAFPRPLRDFLGQQSSKLDSITQRIASESPSLAFIPMLDGLNDSHFCEDRFHPGINGYAIWGEHLARYCGKWLSMAGD